MSKQVESQHLVIIRIWAAMAWADGVIEDTERSAIERLVSVASLSEDETTSALAMLERKVELDLDSTEGLTVDSKLGIYRAALRLAMIDMNVAVEEISMLGRLRKGLNLSEEQALQIEKELSPS